MAEPSKTTSATWSGAEQALRDSDYPRAMELLLTQWRHSPDPTLAGLIERLDARQPMASDFDDALAAPTRVNLIAALSNIKSGVRTAGALERLRALADLKPDPRVAAALCHFIAVPPYTAQSSRAFWTALYEQLLGQHADPKSVERLEPLIEKYRMIFGATVMGDKMQARLKAALQELEQRFAGLETEAPPAALAQWLAEAETPNKKSSTETREDDLLAAIYDDPDSDAPREVYADWLMERGNPRGEFISLQIRRARGEELPPAAEKREAALLKKHMKAWLGPLDGVTHKAQRVFERGFLVSAIFTPVGGKLAAATNHPAWATVRRMSVSYGGRREYGAHVLAQPAMRHLRELTSVPGNVLGPLGEQATEHQLELVQIVFMDYEPGNNGDRFKNESWQPFLTGKGLPRLKTLDLRTRLVTRATFESFWSSPRALSLPMLKLGVGMTIDGALVKAVLEESPPSLQVEISDSGYTLSVKRGGPVRFDAKLANINNQDFRFRGLLNSLPEDLKAEFEVRDPSGGYLDLLRERLRHCDFNAVR